MADDTQIAKLQEHAKGFTREAVDALLDVMLAAVPGGTLIKRGSMALLDHLANDTNDVQLCMDHLAAEVRARLDQHREDPQSARRVLSEYLVDPERNRTLRTGLRDMLDVTSSRAWPCIAALTADYWADGKHVDGFFKDATGFLADCVGEDLDAIGVVLAHGKLLIGHVTTAPRITLNYNGPPNNSLTVPDPHEFDKPEYWLPMPLIPVRGMQLLGRHRFVVCNSEQIQIADRVAECWRLLHYLALRDPAPT